MIKDRRILHTTAAGGCSARVVADDFLLILKQEYTVRHYCTVRHYKVMARNEKKIM